MCENGLTLTYYNFWCVLPREKRFARVVSLLVSYGAHIFRGFSQNNACESTANVILTITAFAALVIKNI